MTKRRSRRPLTLKLLEHAADGMPSKTAWPKPTPEFQRMSAGLEQALGSAVMDSTWDASHLEDWMWDAYAQRFEFYVHNVFRMGPSIDGRPVSIKSRFYFDPTGDWLVELDRVSDEIKKYSDNLLLMQRAYFASLKKEP